MKQLKKELRLYIAELLIYWSIRIAPEVIELFIKKENEEARNLVIQAKEYIKKNDL